MTNLSGGYQGDIIKYEISKDQIANLSNVDAFVINGMGAENYISQIKEQYDSLRIINASTNILNIMNDANGVANPYTWMDLGNYISQVREVTKQLVLLDENNKEIYEQNAENYIKDLNTLKVSFDTELISCHGKQIVSFQKGFSYIVRNLSMQEITIFYEDQETQMDDENVNMVSGVMKDRQIKVIILDKNDSIQNAEKLVQNTGSRIYKLDLCVDGSKDKNAYLNSMRGNFDIIKDIVF